MKSITEPRIRNHEEFLEEIEGRDVISDELLWKWAQGSHSVSGHMWTMYSICKGIQSKRILEIGFGRTSLMFARLAHELSGEFYCCDTRDFTYLFTEPELEVTRFFSDGSDPLFKSEKFNSDNFDFIFLDYFSGETIPLDFCLMQIRKALKNLKKGGFLCIHDVSDKRYPVSRVPGHLKRSSHLEVSVLPYSQGLCVVRKTKSSPGVVTALYETFDQFFRFAMLSARKLKQKLLR